MVAGQSFTVKFPVTGNFKLICLVHPHMTGVIHVLATNAALPHDQAFYDKQAADQQHSLLTDSDPDKTRTRITKATVRWMTRSPCT